MKDFFKNPTHTLQRLDNGKHKNFIIQIQKFFLDLDNTAWFDLYHFHFDDICDMNISWDTRQKIISTFVEGFKYIYKQITLLEIPYQLWILLDTLNAENDAIYIHTKNPNSSAFPITFSEIDWTLDQASTYFKKIDPSFDWIVGQLINKQDTTNDIYVYATNVGLSLKP